jgi:hypothetical protein
MEMLPTPTVNGNHNRAGLSEKSGDGLATALSKGLISTPQARDWRTGNKLDGKAHTRKMEQGWSIE